MNPNRHVASPRSATTWVPTSSSSASPPATVPASHPPSAPLASVPHIPPLPPQQQQLHRHSHPPHHSIFMNRSTSPQQHHQQRYQQHQQQAQQQQHHPPAPNNPLHFPPQPEQASSDRYISLLLPHLSNDDRTQMRPMSSQSNLAIPTIHPQTQQTSQPQHQQNVPPHVQQPPQQQTHQHDLFTQRPPHFLSQTQQLQLNSQHNRQRLSQQQHQHQQRFQASSSSQLAQTEQHSPDKYSPILIPQLKADELPHLRSIPPLPSAKALQQSSNAHAVDNAAFHSGAMRASSSDARVRARPSSSRPLYNRSPPPLPPDSVNSELIRNFADMDPTSAERSEFSAAYMDLMKVYEEKLDHIYSMTENACVQMTLNSRVPYLEDTITAPVDDETAEDARQKLVVKKKFVEAMEKLQGDQLPTKRRGNLPKESTAYLKRWFDEHYDHPYPSDEEKLAMSKAARIGITQISHWFINHRKRVWKPSLPASHPVHNGDSSNKKRKKSKKDLPLPR